MTRLQSGEVAVIRVQDESGSHIEPPLDETWTDLDKLRWHAAVVAADTGLRVSVQAAEQYTKAGVRWEIEVGLYSVNVGFSATSGLRFDRAWTYLNGVSTGSAQTRRQPS